MGQIVTAVLYGCEVPKRLRFDDDDAPDGGLYERWIAHAGYGRGKQGRLVSSSIDHGPRVIGFWALNWNEGVRDKPRGSMPLDEIATSKAGARAAAAWAKFASWSRAQGVTWSAARLWIVLAEVA